MTSNGSFSDREFHLARHLAKYRVEHYMEYRRLYLVDFDAHFLAY